MCSWVALEMWLEGRPILAAWNCISSLQSITTFLQANMDSLRL
jgi:hypothetical protein